VAKWCGVGVIKFSVGFGKKLFGWRRAETDYQFCAIPLGGYVRMVGDIPDQLTGEQVTDDAVRAEGEVDPRQSFGMPDDISPELQRMLNDKNFWFLEKSLWQRAAIVFAGPLFNLIFAVFTIFMVVLFFGKPIGDPFYGGTLENLPATISKISSSSPAEEAGIEVGDKILSINGVNTDNWIAVSNAIKESEGRELQFSIENETGQKRISLTPSLIEVPVGEEVRKTYLVGISPVQVRDAGFLEAVKSGFTWTWNVTVGTYVGIGRIFTGGASVQEIGGPGLIFSAAGAQAERGFQYLLDFMALLSVSLAVLNLLPIPILDGGHLLFFALEGLFGSISLRTREIAQTFGLVIIMGLMALGIVNDFTRDPLPTQSNSSFWEENSDKPGNEERGSPATQPATASP
jgi:regulator of sigma E protease